MSETKCRVKCNKCDWRGEEDDLEYFTDADGGSYGCPNCMTDENLMDIEAKEKGR